VKNYLIHHLPIFSM